MGWKINCEKKATGTDFDQTNGIEFVVKNVVKYIIEDGKILYRVHWYGYVSNNDTVKGKNVCQHTSFGNIGTAQDVTEPINWK